MRVCLENIPVRQPGSVGREGLDRVVFAGEVDDVTGDRDLPGVAGDMMAIRGDRLARTGHKRLLDEWVSRYTDPETSLQEAALRSLRRFVSATLS
jgi:hypothetical protein